MKILHINTKDMDGGAARAAFRIHQGLLDAFVDSDFFVKKKTLTNRSIIVPNGLINNLKLFINERMDFLIKKLCGKKTYMSWSSNQFIFDISGSILEDKYDVVNLHWINEGFFPVNKIATINQPIVWTLHDSWPFTGGCNIPYGCKKYEFDCANCEQLEGSNRIDLSKYMFHSKMKAYKNGFSIVCPSRWLADCAKRSMLLRNMDIKVIPNGIDTAKYHPVDKNVARAALGLSKNCKIILFGAMNAMTDKNKGYDYLNKAIQLFYEKRFNTDVEVIVFGGESCEENFDFGFRTWYTGRLYDDISIKLLYGAADVMVVPSKSENLPNTVLESMACGTPVVAFNVGGLPDIIDHKVNGYLAYPYDVIDLANGIKYVLDEDSSVGELSKNSRDKIVEVFDIKVVAQQYIDLYTELIK